MSVIELRTFVGTKVKYKSYALTIVEVNKTHGRLMEPITGATAVIPAQTLRSLIMNQKAMV